MRLVDVDALGRVMYADEDNITGMGMTCDEIDAYNEGINVMFRKVKRAPTIDAEIVVRCRDCKHRYGDECPMRHIEWVEYEEDGFMERDDIVHDHTQDDGFCNRGEREDE